MTDPIDLWEIAKTLPQAEQDAFAHYYLAVQSAQFWENYVPEDQRHPRFDPLGWVGMTLSLHERHKR